MIEVAVGWNAMLEVLDGVGAMIDVDFFVGVLEGAGICVGIVVGFDPLVLEAMMAGVFVSDARGSELAPGEKVSIAKLDETEAGVDSCVRPNPIKTTAEVMKRKPNPNSQRARRI